MTADISNEWGSFVLMPTDVLLDDTITGNAKLLYLFLWHYADRATNLAHPSRKRMAEHMGMSMDTVDRAVANLREAGVLEVIPRYSEDGDRTSNGYRILRRGGRTGAATVAAPQGEEQEPPEPEKISNRGVAAKFDEAYALWPKHVKRDEAKKRFEQTVKVLGLDKTMSVIAEFGAAYARTTESQFIPALGPWLFQKRWTDDLPKPPDTAPPSSTAGTAAPPKEIETAEAHNARLREEERQILEQSRLAWERKKAERG